MELEIDFPRELIYHSPKLPWVDGLRLLGLKFVPIIFDGRSPREKHIWSGEDHAVISAYKLLGEWIRTDPTYDLVVVSIQHTTDKDSFKSLSDIDYKELHEFVSKRIAKLYGLE